MTITPDVAEIHCKNYGATMIDHVFKDGRLDNSIVTFPNVYSAASFADTMTHVDEMFGPVATGFYLAKSVYDFNQSVTIYITWNAAYGDEVTA